MHNTLDSKNDINRHYASRKKEGKRRIRIEVRVDATILGIEKYIKKKIKERLITAASNSKINRNNLSSNR